MIVGRLCRNSSVNARDGGRLSTTVHHARTSAGLALRRWNARTPLTLHRLEAGRPIRSGASPGPSSR